VFEFESEVNVRVTGFTEEELLFLKMKLLLQSNPFCFVSFTIEVGTLIGAVPWQKYIPQHAHVLWNDLKLLAVYALDKAVATAVVFEPAALLVTPCIDKEILLMLQDV